MATIRSSVPSRLRQLLSADGSLGPSLKLDSEPPPKVKAFIDKVIQSPLQDIAIPLSGFRWEYNKGNFHHWRPLFLHFDTYFKEYLSSRNDLTLSDRILEDDSPFPKHAVLQILRVMQTILENCHNKSSFDGIEHFKLLLASTDPEIVVAALETLSALVKISPSKLHGSGKLIGCGSVNSYLLSLAQGWGSKEEGLGLYSCVVANDRTQEEGLCLFPSDIENDCDKSQCRIGSTLYFEFHGHNGQSREESSGNLSSSLRVIHLPDLHLRKEDDLVLMKHCIEEYSVPSEVRFSLLTRIRYAHAFRSPRICRLYSRICLLAFIVLVQSSDAQDELTSFFANEPEYTNELIRIVRSEEAIPGTIRTLAMLALGAQLAAYSASHDRARILSGSSISFAVGNRMILLNVLQRAVLSLKNSNDPSSIAFVEALLQFYLLHIVSSSSSGSTIRGSGMVPTFLPLLEDSDPSHMHLVYLAVKALQKLMDYSSSAVSLLRELGGVELLAQRLEIEVNRIIGLPAGNDNAMVIGECSRYIDDQLFSQKRLIKVLLKALGSATYTPANSNRPQNSHDNSLPATLSRIYRNADKFGGDIYYSAVTVMSEIIHKDPTCLPSLLEVGLPEAFLSSVVAGILPSSKALTCVPNGLGAICLNAKGLEAVKETSALRFLVDILTSKKYVVAMNEAIVPLANAVEELLRHVSSLRGAGVDIIIEITDKLSSLGDHKSSSSSGKVNGSTAMEMDSEEKENAEQCCIVGAVDPVTEGVSDEQFVQLCIFHLMVLLHRTMENSETCRLFVEKSGIEALLKLLLRPSIAQSSEGMSIALHSTIVFKGFTQHHSASLARAFCSSLRDQLKKALGGLSAASGSFLLDPRVTQDTGIFSPLFLVEFLLFLAASRDNRWVTALLSEFGNGSKDVLEDIGQVHHEILWQMALLEDAKLETDENKVGFATETQESELNTNETEEQRPNSLRQFLDPLFRRRTSGWNIESQFFDLINLYRDLGRAATGFQLRPATDGSSNLRFGASHSGSSDGASGSATRKEHDKQRSYYTSCCDMVRSLSLHITHLFQELGKAMLLPSRRREETVNISVASKSVASTCACIALDHMNFGGHVNPSEASISTKCRYFGKVIEFIDGIILDRPDSCNPVLLNCLYARGVVQSVLTTFEATSQLLFAVNRAPSSPMETDDGNVKHDEKEDVDHVWIYGPLASYGKLMDHLVTSSLILSTSTKHLLVQPLTSGDSPFPRDAETFVKVLQSMVLKSVLPVWAHPQFTDCSYDFITTVISIIRHVYSGVEVKNINNIGNSRITGPPPNESAISTIVEMGFPRARAEEALRQVGSNSVELAMEWLLSHPEETQEDDELARALAMSLGKSESETKEDAANDGNQQLEQDIVQLPPVEELLSTCMKLLQMKEPLAFPVRDFLVLVCTQNDGQYRSNVISFILEQVKDCTSVSDGRNSALLLFMLKLLTEILLMYSSAVHVLLRRDAELNSCRAPHQKGSTGGIFYHILHRFIPCYWSSKKERKVDGDWRQKLAYRANQFLVASCVRSAEARRRIFMEISCIFNDFVDSCNGFRSPGNDVQTLIELLNDVLAARAPNGLYISAEASATFIDVGLVRSLTRTLEVLDLDHAESPKAVTGLIKVLELVTKEHVHSVDSNVAKGENANKSPDDHDQPRRTDNATDMSQSMEMASELNHDPVAADRAEIFNTVQHYGESEAVTDDMEHDQDLDGGFAPAAEDDYMQETSEDARDLENGIDTVGIRFEIQPHVQENLDEDEDEEMSGDDGDEVDEDEDEDDEEHNDLEEDEVHHLPHHDTDQDEHEIDDDEFDEEILEEDEDEDEDDEDGVILRFEEGINGINVFDHIEVFGRDHSFPNEALHVMPVEVFGSRRQGRTTSIYSLLGRTGDNAVPTQHPLLSGPSSLQRSISQRQSENTRDVALLDRNSESNSSRLDAIFRSLRNVRHGHRMNLWMDDNHPSGGPNPATVPQGLEELLVSQLRRPSPTKPSDQNTSSVEPQTQAEAGQLQESVRPEAPAENNFNANLSLPPPSSVALGTSADADMRAAVNDPIQVNDVSSAQSQSVEMQFEQSDAAVRDVEAVSQESGGSGATLGESLRSLDVEIGSADGHDDGGERHGSADPQTTRTRRSSVSFGNSVPSAVRDVSLHSVTEVSENSSREADQDGPSVEQQVSSDAGSGSIDPAFLEALPEELRAEVLSAQHGQVAQPSNNERPNAGDIDPEFLAALPPDIRAEVLAQQQAQRLHQSQELEGQPVEMDTVSIIATFPSELREEVLLTSSDAILANLTPALVAEANLLRERFAHRYHNRTLFGMYPRSRRGESSRRSEGVGSSLDRAGGSIVSRRSLTSKVVEADGAPLVSTEGLLAMIRLLRIVQPLYKGSLQRLLLNLCSHSQTRTALVKILMDMLMLDMKKPGNCSNVTEPLYRLYACQSNVKYSRPQYFDGVPPLVSRRVLETLTYLARHHPYVAKILLQFSLPLPSLEEQVHTDQARGKAAIFSEEHEINKKQNQGGYISIELLLSLLNQPLYLRSIAHLEQLLNLLDVIVCSAESKSGSSDKSDASVAEHRNVLQLSVSDVAVSMDNRDLSSGTGSSSRMASTSSAESECDAQSILLNLPQHELQLLCSLLAREGLSDNAYTLVAEVLKKLVSITPSHCQLFITELANATQNLTKSAMDELRMFGEAVKALLSTSSSDGAAILRVLQALSSLVGSLIEKEKDQQVLPEKDYSAALSQVTDINGTLEPLWLELSSCISKMENYSDTAPDSLIPSRISTSKPSGVTPPLPAGAQNILPYIESFFVVCEKLHPAQPGSGLDFSIVSVSEVEDASTSTGQPKTSEATPKVDEKHAGFVKFSEKHRKLLNAFIRQNPGLLEKSFSLMLSVPRFVDFDNKRSHFRSKIKHQHDHHHSPLRISVRRAYILEDSYNQLRMRSTQELKGRLTVHFQGEEGIDAGGLTREWYQLLSRVIFDKGALLFTTVGNESTFQPNPNSVYQTEHLSYFKFVGRVVGKALFDGQLLDVHFTRSFYKHILGVKVTYHDIEAIDPDYFKNLKWMLENDISDVPDLTFSIDADEEKLILYERTEVTDHELIPGGRNMKVTEENKHQYVDLVAEHRLTTAIRPQINAFLEGFNELIPRDLISIFNDKELELLISGLPDIDLDDMRANTEYSGYSPGSPVIQWFWEVVQGFSKEDKARLLQFVTGTSKVPLEGFVALQGISGSQKFQIHKAYGSPDHLPSAHTCFNQLDLPEYPSKQHLEERLLLAIHEGNEGFGFG
ncbi:E3 ubiquitin-protein ligase UPL1-like [Carica papaya]|uniref:E3 ubiquitin-protein ligase UPL1-like n=1 Tax=Carica papaya TaxID=3649 RepID=UPI000B8CA647|nr:E3 ubiquitin-protein ligase UPL1-like [Carica papaya]